MQYLIILFGWCLFSASLAAPLRWIQLGHYRPWRLPSVKYLIATALQLVFALVVCLLWTYVPALAAYRLLGVSLCYLPQVVVAALFFTAFPKRTARLVRLWIASASLLLAVAILCMRFATLQPTWGLWGALGYWVVQVAACLTNPIEIHRNRRYVTRQSLRLRSSGVVVVGITGSAGKTSVKQLLTAALGEHCFATPGNYNTPMGLASSVRAMPDNTRYFVAEMGAAKTGDIDELLAFVRPQVGVLTCVLPQHTARFGGVEDIRKEKSKLLSAAEWSVSGDPATPACCRLGYGEDAWVENVRLFKEQTSFDIVTPFDRIGITLPLLGRQCAYNALSAYVVAKHLGVSSEHILERWSHVKRDPHRLCPTQNAMGVTIIDDSYNCNILGAQYALEYLSLYEGRKVVATSGIDESDPSLGLNEQLGRMIDRTCDVAIVVGKRYYEALCATLATCKVYFVPDTASCVSLYAKLLQKGDALLVMADYPT